MVGGIPSLMAVLLSVTLMGRTRVVVMSGMDGRGVVTQLSTALVLTV